MVDQVIMATIKKTFFLSTSSSSFVISDGKFASFACRNINGSKNTKVIIRIRKLKVRQHNGQKKTDKRTNNDLQNITQKTTDLAPRIPLKPDVNSVLRKGEQFLLH